MCLVTTISHSNTTSKASLKLIKLVVESAKKLQRHQNKSCHLCPDLVLAFKKQEQHPKKFEGSSYKRVCMSMYCFHLSFIFNKQFTQPSTIPEEGDTSMKKTKKNNEDRRTRLNTNDQIGTTTRKSKEEISHT